jgi:uncharacterized protein YyaL (SSP411 family)
MVARNHLAASSSPYLQKHADNPVDWYPWGPEALAKARAEDRPILLSIGYAACHWCHVMERESFEDPATAALMNELFVNIKVDREERPDLDHVYQLVVQLMGRSGGWPLTVFLTPDQRPFFGGTYFPPADRHGMPSFSRVLRALADAYRDQRGDVFEQAQDITRAIDRAGQIPSAGAAGVGPDALPRAAAGLLARADPTNGGFGARPKFPNTMGLDVLLRRACEGDHAARDAVERALDHMRAGGIWDHLRGGFHRYSTDEAWLVPHFEKMLYDNALLLRLYVDGYRALGVAGYAETARALVGWLFAEMRDDAHGGAFFASQDADSAGHEGTFFVWTPRDLRDALAGAPGSAEMEAVARAYFGVTDAGTFEGSGASVLSEAQPIEAVAGTLGIPVETARATLETARGRMLAFREKRERPMRDDKVLASWNGLLIGALAEAGRALGEPSWVEAAERAFATIERGLLRDDRFGRYLKDGVAASTSPGFLDDQAYMANAALDLYEATGEARYVATAERVARAMIAHHEDRVEGGFFFAADDGDALIARTKDLFDQAIPSAAAVAATVCCRLGGLGAPDLAAHGDRQLEAAAPAALANPFGMGQAVLGIDEMVRGRTEVVVVGAGPSAEALVTAAFRTYVPRRTLARVDPTDTSSVRAAGALAEGKPAGEHGAVAYVCRDHACSAPVSDPAELERVLRAAS